MAVLFEELLGFNVGKVVGVHAFPPEVRVLKGTYPGSSRAAA